MSTPNFIQIQQAFCAHLRRPTLCQPPENTEKNIYIYRQVSLYSTESLLEPTFPVLQSILTKEQWKSLIIQFFEDCYVQSPLSSNIPHEFVEFLKKLSPKQPPFLYELAHYEWVELAVMLDNNKILKNQELNLNSLILNPTLKLLTYTYPVHKICVNFQPSQPVEIPIFLAIYRDKNHTVQFMELNAMSAKVLELVHRVTSADEVFTNLINALPQLKPETISTHGNALLRQLFESDVLL